MEYVKLGNTGLDVSKICLGMMSFGKPGNENGLFPWAKDFEDAKPIFKKAIELGINFFDTANIYQMGSSEEVTGKLIKEFGLDRDDIVVASKVRMDMRPGKPNGGGLSRKEILARLASIVLDAKQAVERPAASPLAVLIEQAAAEVGDHGAAALAELLDPPGLDVGERVAGGQDQDPVLLGHSLADDLVIGDEAVLDARVGQDVLPCLAHVVRGAQAVIAVPVDPGLAVGLGEDDLPPLDLLLRPDRVRRAPLFPPGRRLSGNDPIYPER